MSIIAVYRDVPKPPVDYTEFDFSSLPIDPRITFTRASTGTYFDANGVMQTAAINQPRIDHDPVTGEVRGLLVEEQRTNALLNSATLATQSVTVTAAARTLSFYGTGTVTLSGASTAGPLVGTGATDRVSLTFTPSAGTLTLTVSGSVTKAQLEAGAFPTSYIPTEGTAMTRAADVAVVNDLSSIRYNASEWSMLIEAENAFQNGGPITGEPGYTVFVGSGVWLGDSVNSFQKNSISPYLDNGTYNEGGIEVFRSNQTNFFARATGAKEPLRGFKYKAAYSFAEHGEYSAHIDGLGGVSLVTSTPTPIAIDRLVFGTARTARASFSGHIRRLRYYPRRLSGTEPQELTA